MRPSPSCRPARWTSLLKPENIGKLQSILTYHVVAGKVMAADVVNLKSAKTVNGQAITISTGDGVKVDGAKVVKTDIECSNGVIHVIDSVILPRNEGSQNTRQLAVAAPRC